MTRLMLRLYVALSAYGACVLVVRAPESPLPSFCYCLAVVFTFNALIAGAISFRKVRNRD